MTKISALLACLFFAKLAPAQSPELQKQLQNLDLQTQLMVAGDYDNVAQVEKLLQQGADVNAKDKEGRTPLLNAITRGHDFAVIELLIKHGADVNQIGRAGQTPLRVILNHQHDFRTLKALIDAGARSEIADDFGSTPIRYFKRHNKEAYALVLERNAGKEPAVVFTPTPQNVSSQTTEALINQVDGLFDSELQICIHRELVKRDQVIVPIIAKKIEVGERPLELFHTLAPALGESADPLIPVIIKRLDFKRDVLSALTLLYQIQPTTVQELPVETKQIAAGSLYEVIISPEIGAPDCMPEYAALMGLGPTAFPAFVRLLQHSQHDVRLYTAMALESATQNDETITAELRKMLATDVDPGTRAQVAKLLAFPLHRSPKTKQALETFLTNPPFATNPGEPYQSNIWANAIDQAKRSLKAYENDE